MSDKYPQFFKMRVSGAGIAVDTFEDQDFETPNQLVGSKTLLAMEVLKVYIQNNPFSANGTGQDQSQTVQITRTKQTDTLQADHDDLIFTDWVGRVLLSDGSPADPATFIDQKGWKIYDVQDSDGNGIVITDKTIHMGIKASAGAPETLTTNAWLLYRMVRVPASEILLEAFLQS